MGNEYDESDMRKSSVSNETVANANCHKRLKEEEEEEEEEALSLCDLPTIDDSATPSRKESPKSVEPEEEFNFRSSSNDPRFNESEISTADELFFQGQILPMRHSVSFDRGSTHLFTEIKRNCKGKCVSSVESLDHCSSGGFTGGSSRSSSINSHHSSCSTNSASTTSAAAKLHRTKALNQFQFSHPSPKPYVRLSSINKNGNFSNPNSRSTLLSLFRVGLVTTPEIAIQDLKFRTNSDRISGKTYGNSSSSKKTKQAFFFNKTGDLFGSCRCSATVIGTVNSRNGVMKRSLSLKEGHHTKEEKQQRAGKQASSRHRTFEWLKQLSLETATDEI